MNFGRRNVLLALVLSGACAAGVFATGGEPVPVASHLANGCLDVTLQKQGAVISELHPAATNVNWLASPEQEAGSARFGHFLCFDRWGPVTEEEAARRIPFHGEAGLVPWRWRQRMEASAGLTVTLPVARLAAKRVVRLLPHAGVLEIVTRFKNPTGERRSYNAVEHALLSPYWLTDDVHVSSNVVRGVLTADGEPVAASEFLWPHARWTDRSWDLRDKVTAGASVVASMVFPDGAAWGWVCLEKRLTHDLLGYVWRAKDYPWLNLYWSADHGALVNRAIEPGTTGLHEPMPVLAQTRRLLGRPVLRALDPGEQRSYKLWCFAVRVSAERTGVANVSTDGRTLRIAFNSGCEPLLLPMQ